MLTQKNKDFAEEYVKCYNATKAYEIAYNASRITAVSNGSKLIRKPEVIEYIKLLQQEQVRRFGDMAEVIAKELFEDIVQKDDSGKHNAGWQKSVDLLQKQLNLQGKTIDINADPQIIINITGDEEE